MVDWAGKEAKEFESDPMTWVFEKLARWGAGLAVGGGLSVIGGYFLQKAGSGADVDAANTVGSVFGNANAAANQVANLFAPLETGLVTLTWPGGVRIITGLKPTTYGDIKGHLTVTDASGNKVADTDLAFVDSNAANGGGGDPVDSGATGSLADGTLYTVDITLHWGGIDTEGKYQTKYIGSNGVVVSWSPYENSASTKMYIAGPNNGNPIDITAHPGSSATPSQGAPSYTNTTVPGVFAQVLGALVGAGVALTDVPRAIMVTPRLLGDSIVMVFGWGLGAVLSYIGPWLFGVGLAMLAVGYAGSVFWPRLGPRIRLGMNARSARLWNRFDRWYKTRRKVQEVWTQKSTEGMIWSANEKPVFVAPVQGTPEYEEQIRELTPPDTQGKPSKGSVTPKKSKETAKEKPVPTPTAETEEVLGERGTRAPSKEELDRMAAEAEKNRRESMPPEAPEPTPPPERPPEAPPEPSPGPTEVIVVSDKSEEADREYVAEGRTVDDREDRINERIQAATERIRKAQADRREMKVYRDLNYKASRRERMTKTRGMGYTTTMEG